MGEVDKTLETLRSTASLRRDEIEDDLVEALEAAALMLKQNHPKAPAMLRVTHALIHMCDSDENLLKD